MIRLGDISDKEATGVRRRVRLITLIDAATRAGIVPIPILRIHTLAYLANVLAPVWDLPVLEGEILKRHGGPFYPALQQDLDRLVGLGVTNLTELHHVEDLPGRWRLEGKYSLNYDFAQSVLDQIRKMPDEHEVWSFIHELVLAISSLSDDDIDEAMREDATYSDPYVTTGNVIDFVERPNKNSSASAADYFETVLPSGDRTTPGEKLHLYVQHLHRRLHGDN